MPRQTWVAGPGTWQTASVIGAILVVVAVVLVLPPMFLMGGLIFSGVLGWLLKDDAEERHAGSELIDLNT
ncbi:MAG: hypothetical protein NVSMB4_19910 [Acidimicrobiales bacterium]